MKTTAGSLLREGIGILKTIIKEKESEFLKKKGIVVPYMFPRLDG
jgi:hypothetical protein